MSRIAKLTLILAIAVITIGATHVASRNAQGFGDEASTPRTQISPLELMRAAGVLSETKIESYEWVYPVP